MANIEGVVEDSESNPIDGAVVEAIRQDTTNITHETTSDANGEFEFDVTDASLDYHLAVRYEDGAGDEFHAITAPFTPGAIVEDDKPLSFTIESYTSPANDSVDYTLETFNPPDRAEVEGDKLIKRMSVKRRLIGRGVIG